MVTSSDCGKIFRGLGGNVHSWSGMLLFVRSALNPWCGSMESGVGTTGAGEADASYSHCPCSMRYTFCGVSHSSLGFFPFRP